MKKKVIYIVSIIVVLFLGFMFFVEKQDFALHKGKQNDKIEEDVSNSENEETQEKNTEEGVEIPLENEAEENQGQEGLNGEVPLQGNDDVELPPVPIQ